MNCKFIRTESEDGRWFEHHYALDRIDFEVKSKNGSKFMKYKTLVNIGLHKHADDSPQADEKIETSSN